jgi:hypothetical protein
MQFLLPIIGGIFLLILSFIGMALSTGGLRLTLRQRRLDNSGLDADATVISSHIKNDATFVKYRYVVGEKSYTREEPIEGDAPPEGTVLPLRYLANNPTLAALAGDTPYSRTYRTINLPLMIVLALVSAAMGVGGILMIVNAAATGA